MLHYGISLFDFLFSSASDTEPRERGKSRLVYVSSQNQKNNWNFLIFENSDSSSFVSSVFSRPFRALFYIGNYCGSLETTFHTNNLGQKAICPITFCFFNLPGMSSQHPRKSVFLANKFESRCHASKSLLLFLFRNCQVQFTPCF
jgi:hypothetical protein